MDALRSDLKRLYEECSNIVIERDDIITLLNGKVQDLINRELEEDQGFSTISLSDEGFSTISLSDDDGRNEIIVEKKPKKSKKNWFPKKH